MSDWRAVIPSYQRAMVLRDCTLQTLSEGGVRPELVDVFVADEAEAAQYRSILKPGSYGRLVVAVPGMTAVRNFITKHYADGQLLVHADDDVRGVFCADEGKLRRLDDLSDFFGQAFEACAAYRARIWGLYPVCNAFYMKGKAVTADLRSIIGVLYGVANDRSQVLECLVKSDIERTLRYFERDGAVVRFNRVAPRQVPFAAGGCQASGLRTKENSQAAVEYLCKRWPRWVKPKSGFKRGHAEVRLVRE